MCTTRHPFHGKMCSRTPSKPCLIAPFLLRFRPQMAGGEHGATARQADCAVPDRHVGCRVFDPLQGIRGGSDPSYQHHRGDAIDNRWC